MTEVNQETKKIIEGLLMVASDPLSIADMLKIINDDEGGDDSKRITINELQEIINELGDDCKGRGVELKEVANGYRFQVNANIIPWIRKLFAEKPPRYSRALLETLAIIAYRQPVTRAEIEDVRGVGVSSNIMKTLVEHEWVEIVGQKEVPGRPSLYATTKKFLDYFNLRALDELPALDTETVLPSVDLPALGIFAGQVNDIDAAVATQTSASEENNASFDSEVGDTKNNDNESQD